MTLLMTNHTMLEPNLSATTINSAKMRSESKGPSTISSAIHHIGFNYLIRPRIRNVDYLLFIARIFLRAE
jgi:hypothetical protein